MSDLEILDGVRQVLRAKLDVERPIETDTNLFSDLEIDSLQQLTLVVELENHFRVCFDPGDEVGIDTVADVVGVIRRSLGRGDGPA